MSKKIVASNNAAVKREINQHFNHLENIEGVIINPYKQGEPIEEAGFTALMRGNLFGGGTGKIKVEVFPHPKDPTKLKALVYDNTDVPTCLKPSLAVTQFSTLAGTKFKAAEKAYFTQ